MSPTTKPPPWKNTSNGAGAAYWAGSAVPAAGCRDRNCEVGGGDGGRAPITECELRIRVRATSGSSAADRPPVRVVRWAASTS